MAQFSFDSSGFNAQIKKLNNIEEVEIDMVNAGIEVLKPVVEQNLDGVISKDLKSESRATGKLRKSIRVKKAKKEKNGVAGYITFVGKNENGERYNEIAAVKEYGRYSHKGVMQPQPFLRPAIENSNEAIATVMENVFKNKIGE